MKSNSFKLPDPVEIGDYLVRPFNVGTMIVLKELGNPMVASLDPTSPSSGIEDINMNTEEGLLAALGFALVHVSPFEDVLKLRKDKDTYRDAVLEFASTFPLGLLPEVITAIVAPLAKEQASPARKSRK